MGPIAKWMESHRNDLEKEYNLASMARKASQESGFSERNCMKAANQLGLVPRGSPPKARPGRIETWILDHRKELEAECSVYAMVRRTSIELRANASNIECLIYRLGLVPRGTKPPDKKRLAVEPTSLEQATRENMARAVATLTDDDVLSQSEFIGTRMVCGYSPAHLRKVREEPEFRAFQIRKGKQVYWCTPATKQWALSKVSGVRDV